jgi:hypothetical protein
VDICAVLAKRRGKVFCDISEIYRTGERDPQRFNPCAFGSRSRMPSGPMRSFSTPLAFARR